MSLTAANLISEHVATGVVAERLGDVAARITALRSHYCVVLRDDGISFFGLVRFSDIAARTNAAGRILGDLVAPVSPLVIRSGEDATRVAELFEQHQLGEAVVLGDNDVYVGLITAESVLTWTRNELRQHLGQSSAGEPRSPTSLLEAEANERRTQSRRKLGSILLVEDHEPSRSALGHILRRRDYEVVECSSMAEALSRAETSKFTLLISDIGLPDGTGYELMAALRKLYGLRGIAISGLGMTTDLVRSKSSGFSYHLKKPVNVQDIELAIAGALAERKPVGP